MFDVSGKVALVTGGCGGIGLAYAKSLLKSNIKGVVLVDIDITNGKVVDIPENKGKVLLFQADITVKEQLRNAFVKTVEIFNQLDIVINNAGLLCEIDPELSITINLVALLNGLNFAKDEFLPKYRSGNEGLIINTSSVGGLYPSIFVPTYCASKAAVLSLGRTLGAPEIYASTKARIITICPAVTLSPFLKPENMIKYLSQAQCDGMANIAETNPPQTCDQLVDCVMRIINKAESGSVWLVEGGIENKADLEPLYGQHR